MSAMAFLRMAARSAGRPGVAPNGRLALRSPENATQASRSLGSSMPSTNLGSAATSAWRECRRGGAAHGQHQLDGAVLMHLAGRRIDPYRHPRGGDGVHLVLLHRQRHGVVALVARHQPDVELARPLQELRRLGQQRARSRRADADGFLGGLKVLDGALGPVGPYCEDVVRPAHAAEPRQLLEVDVLDAAGEAPDHHRTGKVDQRQAVGLGAVDRTQPDDAAGAGPIVHDGGRVARYVPGQKPRGTRRDMRS